MMRPTYNYFPQESYPTVPRGVPSTIKQSLSRNQSTYQSNLVNKLEPQTALSEQSNNYYTKLISSDLYNCSPLPCPLLTCIITMKYATYQQLKLKESGRNHRAPPMYSALTLNHYSCLQCKCSTKQCISINPFLPFISIALTSMCVVCCDVSGCLVSVPVRSSADPVIVGQFEDRSDGC